MLRIMSEDVVKKIDQMSVILETLHITMQEGFKNLDEKIERNRESIEKNRAAIEKNCEAIKKNRTAIERNGKRLDAIESRMFSLENRVDDVVVNYTKVTQHNIVKEGVEEVATHVGLNLDLETMKT